MKEHFQDSGVRKWAGNDLIELQSESLEALQGLVEPYAPCVIKGCEVETVPGADGDEVTYKVSGGLVALRGVDAAGNGCVKIARVKEFTSEVMPVYLLLANKQTARAYGDGSSKVIANDYIAECSAIASEGALELTADGGKRLVDMLGITQKLDRDKGEAKDTVVGFTAAADRAELTTGSKLGVLFGLVKKWLTDLRALAFKDKVAKDDLTDELAKELDDKVDVVDGMGLSDNNFTDALKDKLDSVDPSANNYSLPAATGDRLGGVLFGSSAAQTSAIVGPFSVSGRTYPIQRLATSGKMVVNVPWVNTTYGVATTSSSGLMSATDKTKLSGLSNYSHPESSGYRHIPSGGAPEQYLVWSANGVAKWGYALPCLIASCRVAYSSTDGFYITSGNCKYGKIKVSTNTNVECFVEVEDPPYYGFKYIPMITPGSKDIAVWISTTAAGVGFTVKTSRDASVVGGVAYVFYVAIFALPA